MLICDMHCDLPYKVYYENANLYTDSAHWSLNKLKNREIAQVFAIFTDKFKTDNPFRTADAMLDKFKVMAEADDNIKLVTDLKSFDEARKNNKVAALLSIEGGEALGGDVSNLYYFYNKGVRFLTLTWNYPNQLGEGVGDYTTNSGLTDFGREVVKKLAELKMGIDVSHLTEKGFWDVCETVDAPFLATHSNAFSVCQVKRNLTDHQILEIVRRQGLIGVNFYPLFLSGSEKATILDIVKHIEYFMELGCEDSLSLGCDFDGIGITPKGILGIHDTYKLFDELFKINYSYELVAKIAGENAIKYMINNIL